MTLRPTAAGQGRSAPRASARASIPRPGQPESAAREQQEITWLDLACQFTDLEWPHVAAKSRTSIADALATVTPVLVTSTRGMPDGKILQDALCGWAFHTSNRGTVPLAEPEAGALSWLREHSLAVTALDDPQRRSELIRRALNAITLTMGGTPAARHDHRPQARRLLRRAELRRRA